MTIILMGVSGSGKTTVGRALAAQLGWDFHDADDHHPPANVEKMRRGEPLSDADRGPWFEALDRAVLQSDDRGEGLVLACSALKASHRERLRGDAENVTFVYLTGSPELLRDRIGRRGGHFMDPDLLRSQLDALEPPDDALEVDVAPRPDAIAAEIRRRLGL